MIKIYGQRDLVKYLAGLLEKFKINYLLTGSLAVSYYGHPRATHDIDFVIEIHLRDVSKMRQLIKSLGKSFISDMDQIEMNIRSSTLFNIFHTYTGIKIDFWFVERSEFERNKFKRKKIIYIDNQKINLISAEDLILNKLLWCKGIKSERHLTDCKGMLKVQKNELDKTYLSMWVKKLKIEDLFKEISL